MNDTTLDRRLVAFTDSLLKIALTTLDRTLVGPREEER